MLQTEYRFILSASRIGARLFLHCQSRTLPAMSRQVLTSAHGVHEFCWPDVQTVGQFNDIEQGNILLAALDHTNIVAMKVRQFRQFFLR